MNEFIIYSKPDCPWCVKAKELADQHNLTYRVVDITEDPEARDWIIRQGHKTVPQVYIAWTLHIGGYEDFQKYLDARRRMLRD